MKALNIQHLKLVHAAGNLAILIADIPDSRLQTAARNLLQECDRSLDEINRVTKCGTAQG